MFTLVNLSDQALAPPEDVFQHVAFGAAAGAKLLAVRGETLAGRGIGLQNGPASAERWVKHGQTPWCNTWGLFTNGNKECIMKLYNQ